MAVAGLAERAVRAELREIGMSVQTVAAAALCVQLARQIDEARGAVAAAAAAAQVHAIMTDLRARAEARPEEDSRLAEVRTIPASAGRATASSGVRSAGTAI